MLMEQTPSQQNWQPYNSLKRPGQMRAQSYQTIAHGADTIQFFQLRRSVGGCEKFHGAVIAHVGTEDTRVFREVSQLGQELEQLGDMTLGSVNEAEVGIVFDWDNYWALEYTSGPTVDLTYVDQIHQYYKYFYDRNIPVNMIPFDGNLDRYKIIVAPVLYMVKEGMREALENFVQKGGVLVTTYMSGIVDQSDNVYLGGYPGVLSDMAGVWVEEIDALAPEQENTVIFHDGESVPGRLVCDIIHLKGAECIGRYGKDFYAESPAVTRNRFGDGHVYYIGTGMDCPGIAKVLDMAAEDGCVKPVVEEETGLEITCRRKDGYRYYFVINFKEEELEIPSCLAGNTDVLTGEPVRSGDTLSKYDVKIIRTKE